MVTVRTPHLYTVRYDMIIFYITFLIPQIPHPSLFCTDYHPVEALMTVSHPKAITPSHYVTGDDPKALPLSRPSSYALAFTFSTASHWKHPRNLMVLCYAPSRGDMLHCLIQCWPHPGLTMKSYKKCQSKLPVPKFLVKKIKKENITFFNIFYSVHFEIIVTNYTNKIHTILCFNLQKFLNVRVSLVHHQRMRLYKTIARPYYHLQFMEQWWDH